MIFFGGWGFVYEKRKFLSLKGKTIKKNIILNHYYRIPAKCWHLCNYIQDLL